MRCGTGFTPQNAVFVVGPTASGKSEFAFLLAKKLNGAVISADSMQLWRGLDIGTAKESTARREEIPHFMLDVADPDEEFSVARWREQALDCLSEVRNRGLLPIFVGGTGLYFESLFYPMTFADEDKNPVLRTELESAYASEGGEKMLARLAVLDPESAARLHPNDKKRVVRALEIASAGKKLSRLEDRRQNPDVTAVGFNAAERAKLYARIDERVDIMLKSGLCAEIARLAPDFSWQSMQAIGYKEFAPFADRISDGKIRLDRDEVRAVAELIKKHTRNYAKRQLTWFRRYPFVKWFELGDFDGAEQYVIGRLKAAE